MNPACLTANCPKFARAAKGGLCDRCDSRERYRKNPAHRRQWSVAHPEHITVRNHYHMIQNEDKNYLGMPFYDEWNPNKGGSYGAGVQWIIENIGRKPAKGYDLHIVDRTIGFMPGNLQWVHRTQHQQEEIVTKLKIENQQLKNIIKRAGIDQSALRYQF